MYAKSLNNKIIHPIRAFTFSGFIWCFFFVFEKKNIAINLADG